MKKIFSIFGILFLFAFTTLAVYANSNYLHNITLEKNIDSGYNIVLDVDKAAKITKRYISPNEMMINIKGVVSADTVNAIYKGTDAINSLVVENTGANSLRIFITAQGIGDSSIFIKTPDGLMNMVGESFPIDKALWIGFSILLMSVIFGVSKKISEDEDKVLIKKDIKDREIELYRQYRKNLDQNLDLSKYNTLRMRGMQRKIDRKIDERLFSSLR